MKSYKLEDIPPETFFSKAVFLEDQFVLAAPERPLTPEIIQALKDWQFKEVQSEGEPRADGAGGAEQSAPEEAKVVEDKINDSERLTWAEEFYRDFEKYTEQLFERAAATDTLDFDSIAEKIKVFCSIIPENHRFLLRVQKKAGSGTEQNYLASHAVNSTIIAVIIGSYLKLPPHRLIELGIAALLHEVGMLKLPSRILSSSRPLNPAEQKMILTHPVLGYKFLKDLNFPLAISVAALEHHERENGSGYPRKLSGEKISLYAKIIAVACSYEALSISRPHRDAKDGFTGMLELLKNEGKRYDDTVVRALVYSLSLYPIGLYVLLSNGEKGQVVDVNPGNPRFPIVQILEESAAAGKKRTIETSAKSVFIVRPLTREETGV
jgi:HD-GYP domain-containing protein (c-di-GMP phosphodiesterase class II)